MIKLTNKTIRFIQWIFYFFSTGLLLASHLTFAANETLLSDKPIFSGAVNGNVALALSVEYPTGVTSSYKDAYATTNTYLGYFDPDKCYKYNSSSSNLTGLYNTGVNSANVATNVGSDDANWIATNKPTTTDLNNVVTTGDGNSAFIGSSGNSVAGDYYYQTTFTIPTNVDPTKVSISFNLWADDSLKTILVNCTGAISSCTGSQNTGITSTANATTPAFVNIPAGLYPFKVGSNTLTIVLNNYNSTATSTYAATCPFIGSCKCSSGDSLTSSTLIPKAGVCTKTTNSTTPVTLRIDDIAMTAPSTTGSYFEPVATTNNHTCNTVTNGRWSGNYLNWGLTQVIDPLRQVMTGGFRRVDNVGMTLLEKAYADGQGGKLGADHTLPNATLVSQSTPFSNLTTLTMRINGLGNKFYFTSTGNADDPNATGGLLPDTAVTTTPTANRVYEMTARIQVCKTGLLESNCSLYPNGDYKPTGLIQKNASKLKFAAFGYLNDNTNPYDMSGPKARDGGVLRARMSSVGPNGDYPEWDANTGQFLDNPNKSDADASGVTKSGVINYLNQFGYNAPGYKVFDPVSELYYATTRYFRNKGNVPTYSSGATVAMKDGFPVIETWNDPIKYSCESNFIIGVGDTRTHADGNLPGAPTSSYEPAQPDSVKNDTEIDVVKSTNKVGSLQGYNIALAAKPLPWCCGDNSTFFMAGLAYDVHTRDIRSDLSGNQTITTYWLDTLETGDEFDNDFVGMRNQFWLATKYGGFKVPDNYAPYSTSATAPLKADWDSDNNGDPDNYFRANNPSLMINGLNAAFDNIVSKVESITTGFSLSSPNISINDLSFSAKYNARYWTGTITGNTVDFSTGNPVLTTVWTTDTTLENQAYGTGWDTKRFIATSSCSAKDTQGSSTCTGVPFRYASLNASDKTAISTVGIQTNVGTDAVNFLRGDRSKEGVFRVRNRILGDMVNSKIRAVGKPNTPYSETKNPGYQNFIANYSNRSIVAYVGANDGMLHAFRGTDGKELFAYVPNALFQGPNNTPNDNGLAALAKTTYAHRAYVDSTPVVFDVNFGTDKAPDWHSLLLGGLGKGGKSYYALDVTNPDDITDETKLASKVQWEFTHKDLGYSYGRPVVVKAGGKWIVILTSGYNNADGQGYFFILNAKTGTLIKKVGTGEGYPTDAGLAHATAFIADSRDFTSDAAYAGDLHGNVWRLDLTDAANDNYPTPTKIAKLTSANNDAQPITVAPMVEVDQSTSKRYVFVGTGKVLSDEDISTTKTQSFYAILDGTDKAFFNNATLPSSAKGFPVNRDEMVNHTDKVGAVVTDTEREMGYYIDFGEGYQVSIPMDTSAGVISLAANKVSGDQCNISALFRGYALSYGSGKSLLVQNGITLPTQYYQGNGVVTGIAIYKKPNSPNFSVNFSGDPEVNNKSVDTQSAAPFFQMLNWRTIPNND